MKRTTPARLAAALLLTLSSLLTIAAPTVHATGATPATCTWIGTAGDNSFGTAANWSNCNTASDGIPHAGDVLNFTSLSPSSGNSTTAVLTNNLNVAFGGVTLYQTSNTINTYYYISALTLANGATYDATNVPSSNARTFIAIGSFNTTTSTSTYAPLIGQGALTVNGSAPSASVYNITGVITFGVDGGTGTMVNAAGIVLQNGANLTVFSTSTTQAFNTPLTLGGGGGSDKSEVNFYDYCPDRDCTSQATTFNVSSPITLLGNAYFNPGDTDAVVNVTGSITGSNFSLQKDPNARGVLNLNPSSNDSQTVAGVASAQASTMTISDSLPNANLNVPNLGVYTLDGSRGLVEVQKGGTLKGTGSAANLYVDQGATVAPGHSPGTLTVTSSLNIGSGATYQAELKDSAAGDYDQIVVGNASDSASSNDVSLGYSEDTTDPLPTLAVSLYDGYNIKVGDKFEIINNLGQAPVSGTFAGLAEGGAVSVNGYTFTITYKGGDGNDVVLTATAVPAIVTPPKPATPDTGLALVAAHPMASFTTSVIAAGALYFAARKLKPARR